MGRGRAGASVRPAVSGERPGVALLPSAGPQRGPRSGESDHSCARRFGGFPVSTRPRPALPSGPAWGSPRARRRRPFRFTSSGQDGSSVTSAPREGRRGRGGALAPPFVARRSGEGFAAGRLPSGVRGQGSGSVSVLGAAAHVPEAPSRAHLSTPGSASGDPDAGAGARGGALPGRRR